MNVSCPECRSVFRVDPTKLPTITVRARCSVCGGVISISAGSSIDDDFSTSAVTSRPASHTGAEPSTGQRGNAGIATALLDSFSPPTPRAPTPIPPAPAVGPRQPARSLTPPASMPAPVSKPINSSPAPAPPGGVRPVLFPPRPMMPGNAAPAAPSGLAARPIVAPRPAAPPAAPSASSRQPVGAPTPRPVGGVPVAGSDVASAPAPSSAPVASPPVRQPPAAAPAAAGTGSPTPARSPINPFLANDPHAKAKRLARALISDLVTYFPQKRQDGLRDGTLKQLFKDEIQKSHEEYVAQIGREFAESTPHFQDALNDILAGGQKVF